MKIELRVFEEETGETIFRRETFIEEDLSFEAAEEALGKLQKALQEKSKDIVF